MERLAGIDAAFLYVETETTHMHVVGTIVLDEGDVPFDFDRLRRLIASRLHRIPQFRRRMVHVPLRLGHPVWIDDPTFRLDAHLHRIGVPRPGSMRELAGFVGHLASIPLDRKRPLWDIWAVEGLRGGQTALVCKFHHAAIDGVTGADIMQHLFDLDPDVADDDAPTRQWAPEPRPSGLRMLCGALGEIATQPLRMARSLVRTAASLRAMGAAYLSPRSAVSNPALPLSSPHTLLNGAISSDRSVAFGHVSLRDVKTIKNALGLTVNDVILAACSLAIREYLEAHDATPTEALIAAIPVSLRGQRGDDSNNAVSAMFVRLPVHLKEPAQHLDFVRAEATEAKALHTSSGVSLVSEWAEFASATWFAGLINLYSSFDLAETHAPLYNLVISNVPGPRERLYCAGQPVAHCYPLGPIFEGAAVNITVMSYVDGVDVGVIACPKSAPDTEGIVHGFERAIRDLLRAADDARSDHTS